jgi:hypothetical protein
LRESPETANVQMPPDFDAAVAPDCPKQMTDDSATSNTVANECKRIA